MIGNIMIIDDSPVERKIFGQAIKKRVREVNIFEAENGLDISKKLLENNIHLCILDIMMPEKNGFEILKEIKEDNSIMDIPVIVCTGMSDREAIEKALSLGAYDYFSKPLSEEEMKISLPIKAKNAIELMMRNKEIINLIYCDKVTGLFNRRYFEEELAKMDTDVNLPFSLVVGDVNGLKLTNDAFGHEVGDKLLKKIASIMDEECENIGVAARIGGDEFIMMLPKTDEIAVKNIIARIKDKCDTEKEDPIKPSISFGYAIKENYEQNIMDAYKTAEDRMYNNKLSESKIIKSSIISTLINILNRRSDMGENNSGILKDLSEAMGKEIGLNNEQIDNLKLLVLIHDIGITAIPNYAVKKTKLSQEEECILKNHCEIGYRMANSLADVAPIATDILSHHERWDGSGYPQGIKGEAIPLNARIISILDTYDSLINGEKPVPKEEALNFIKSNSGIYFDPKLVDAFLKIVY